MSNNYSSNSRWYGAGRNFNLQYWRRIKQKRIMKHAAKHPQEILRKHNKKHNKMVVKYKL